MLKRWDINGNNWTQIWTLGWSLEVNNNVLVRRTPTTFVFLKPRGCDWSPHRPWFCLNPLCVISVIQTICIPHSIYHLNALSVRYLLVSGYNRCSKVIGSTFWKITCYACTYLVVARGYINPINNPHNRD